MLYLFRKLPPWFIKTYLVLSTFFVAAKNLLFGSLRGMLIFSLLIYGYFWFLTSIKPLTGGELIMWFSDLSVEVKTSIATTLTTVVGFFVAFIAATSGWKEQARINLQLSVATDLEKSYEEALKLAFDLQLYAESVVDEIGRIKSENINPEEVPSFDLFIRDAATFREKRDRLSKLSIEMHRLQGKHYFVLSHIAGALQISQACIDSLDKISDAMWISVPIILNPVVTSRGDFFRRIDLKSWSDFIAICDQETDLMGGYVGGLRGLLFAPLMKFTIASFWNITAKRKEFEQAFNSFQATEKNKVKK